MINLNESMGPAGIELMTPGSAIGSDLGPNSLQRLSADKLAASIFADLQDIEQATIALVHQSLKTISTIDWFRVLASQDGHRLGQIALLPVHLT